MWDKYGEMNSAEEINEKAKKMREEGKPEELKEMAKENGLDEDMVDFFLEGEMDIICDNMSAAIGKLQVEIEHYQKQYAANAKEVVEALESMMSRECVKLSVHKYGVDIDIDVTGDNLAEAIRSKGKDLNTICKDVFTKAQKIHLEGNPASALVVPMIIHQYLQPVKGKKEDKKK